MDNKDNEFCKHCGICRVQENNKIVITKSTYDIPQGLKKAIGSTCIEGQTAHEWVTNLIPHSGESSLCNA